MGIERAVWSNANPYPQMLITSELYNFDDEALIKYSKICGEALEQKKFKNGIMIRCGLV
jgi:hypothetical protein